MIRAAILGVATTLALAACGAAGAPESRTGVNVGATVSVGVSGKL